MVFRIWRIEPPCCFLCVFFLYFLLLLVFKLLANSDPHTGSDQFGKIGVEGMVRESGDFHVLTVKFSIGGCDTENLACLDSILSVGLVEISGSEQKYCVGMLFFHPVELLHDSCRSIGCFRGFHLF